MDFEKKRKKNYNPFKIESRVVKEERGDYSRLIKISVQAVTKYVDLLVSSFCYFPYVLHCSVTNGDAVFVVCGVLCFVCFVLYFFPQKVFVYQELKIFDAADLMVIGGFKSVCFLK